MLHSILSAICRRTRELSISAVGDLWVVELGSREKGRAIGKNGRTSWALTTLAWYAAVASNDLPRRVQILGDPPSGPATTPFKINPDWDRGIIGRMINSISDACFKKSVPWVIEDTGPGVARVTLEVDAYLQTALSDPRFEEALSIVVHSGGMSDGADIKTFIEWK